MGTRRDRAGSPVQPYRSAHKCPKHNQWKKKGVCELCSLENDDYKRRLAEAGGSNKHLYKKNDCKPI